MGVVGGHGAGKEAVMTDFATDAWALFHAGPVWGTNARLHWAEKARRVAEWRDAFAWLAKAERIPHLDRCSVDAAVTYARGRQPDIGHGWEAIKAGVDGLVDAGVMDDDDPTHLVSLTMPAPRKGDRAGLTITVRRML